MVKTALVVFFSMLVSCLYAQTDIVKSTHTLDSIVVKAHNAKSNVLSTVPMEKIGKDQIEQLGITSVADAVKKIAGVTVKDYGGIGGMKTVSVRNLGANHTSVSYDGVMISNMSAGQIDIGRFSIDNIADLSLSVGQSDDYMQSARHYASAGVLSIETEKPHFNNCNDYSARLRIRGGSFGLISPSLRYWQKFKDSTTLSLDGSFMRADGIFPFTLINGKLKTKERRHNSDIYSWQGEMNLYHTFADRSNLSVKAYCYSSQRGLPGAVILYNDNNNERLWDKNVSAQAVYSKNISKIWQLETRIKYAHTFNKYEDTNVKYQDGKQTDIDRQNEYYASATIGCKPVKHLTFAFAQDAAIGTLNNNIETQPNPVRYTSLSALSAKYRADMLQINADIIGTFIHEHTDKGDSPSDKKHLSPSLSLSYRLIPDKLLFVRALVKQTFRVPTFTDLYYLRMGNTGLKPEKANEYNIGITCSEQLSSVNFHFTVDGYYNNVRDKIVAFPTTYIWKMTNFGKVHITGLDATLALNLPISKRISADVSAAYTFQRAVDKTDASSSTYDKQLPYTPKNNFNGSIVIKTPWINIGYSLTCCDKRYSMAQGTDEYKLKPYQEHNINLSRDLRFGNKTLRLSATIQNLTNEQYEIIKYYPMPGRNWQITGTLTL